MSQQGKATRIELFNFSTPQMRAFHLSWLAFFVCFFAWFGIAPLMSIVRDELQLTKSQIGWCVIGSVAITIFARLFVGWLCDRIGPRLCYTWLLILGSLPVMGIALANDFWSFLVFRVLIGAIGAAFVITQYHTSSMFADNCVGTANATTAGWGNLGGGVTQFGMPLLFAMFVGVLGFSTAASWRLSMVVAGAMCALMGVAYYRFTQDTPAGNFRALRAAGSLPSSAKTAGTFLAASRDPRVWMLAALYGACFGIELTVKNVAALYFVDGFDALRSLDPIDAARYAGLIVGLYGSMNLFARTLGGWLGDQCGRRWGFERSRAMAVRGDLLRGRHARAVFPDADTRVGDSRAGGFRLVRADVVRGHVFHRAVRDAAGSRIGGGHCRRRRKSGCRGSRLSVQERRSRLVNRFPRARCGGDRLLVFELRRESFEKHRVDHEHRCRPGTATAPGPGCLSRHCKIRKRRISTRWRTLSKSGRPRSTASTSGPTSCVTPRRPRR